MEIALCGLSRAGKSTLWSILTGIEVVADGRVETKRGVTKVPDERLEQLSAMYSPKKKTLATVTYVDVAPVTKGGGGRTENPTLTELRAADALVCVLRGWEDEADPHPEGSVDPARDLELLDTEFLLADLAVAEKRLERLNDMIKKTNKDEDKKERTLIEKVVEHLQAETPLRNVELSDDEWAALRGFAFLSAKPLLVALNLSEDDADKLNQSASELGLGSIVDKPNVAFVALSAKIEQEIASLDAEDADAFRSDLGIEEPALDRLIRASYELLGLICFFTVGEDECRAWTIRRGTVARDAAGAIHSDLSRGFIRAEVIASDKLLEVGSMNAAKEKGWLALEGKEYVVIDGDVMHIRHAS